MACEFCKKEIPDDAEFCPYCNKKIKIPEIQDFQKRYERTGMLRVVLLVVGAICICVAGWFVVEDKPLVVLVLMIFACVSFEFYMFFSYLPVILRRWRKRVQKSEKAAKEFASLVEWESKLIGLESVSPIEFRRTGTTELQK